MPSPDDDIYAPSVFMSDYDHPDPATVVNQSLPRSVEGGVIEIVKRSVTTAVREHFAHHNVEVNGQPVYVDIEYPQKEAHYPGVWVQFSLTGLVRAGIDHGVPIKEDGRWNFVQGLQFSGRVTLAIVALKNKDRDRLADVIISMLAFARPPSLVVTNPSEDIKQHRALLTSLEENPYISATVNLDQIHPSGQTVNVAEAPWKNGALILSYEDGYGFDILGHVNLKFRHDGVYEIARIDTAPELVEEIPEGQHHHVTSRWFGTPRYRSL